MVLDKRLYSEARKSGVGEDAAPGRLGLVWV